MHEHRHPFLPHAAMLVSAALVSTSFPVAKALTATLDPLHLTCWRFVLASFFFWALARLRGPIALPRPADILRYSLISATLVAFFWLMFIALRSTSPLNAAVIFTTVPGLSGLYSWALVRERLGVPRLFALVLAMAGALWILCEGEPQRLLALRPARGDLVFSLACLLMAAYTPLVKRLHRGEPMWYMTLWVLITGACWLLVLCAPALPALLQLQRIPFILLCAILYLALATTILTFFLTQWATLHLGPTRVAAYSLTYPLFIVLFEWGLHGVLPGWPTVVGVCLFFLPAMYALQRGG